jgi:pimeloyl-ACP methyl ester carboxylesterase
MPRARINGLSVHYQQVGQGPDLVLVHGLFCNLAFWYLTVAPMLAKRFRVTVYDLRGHGHTERMPTGYRAIDLADDLVALLDHLGIDRAHLVGHSFGGAVTLACAARHPHRGATLSLVDAWVPSLQQLGQPFWQAQRCRVAAAGLEGNEQLPRVAYGFLEELIDHRERDGAAATQSSLLGPPGIAGDSQRLKKWRQLVEQTSATRELSDVTGLGRREIAEVAMPTSAVFGRRSRFLPTLRALETLMPSMTSRTIANAGHFFPLLKPVLLVEHIDRFLGER